MGKLITLVTFILLSACAQITNQVQVAKYPEHWWTPVSDANIPKWEILPDAGVRNKSVILSKRHELGILSNFAPTPILLNGKQYASVEGLWQSTKYPDPKMKNDPRFNCHQFKLTRVQVEQLVSFEAKSAGDPGSECMKKLGIDWVSFEGKKLTYREKDRGAYFDLIYSAMKAKLEQNPRVKEILLQTQGLELLPDHHTKSDDPPAWRYFEIWQELRNQLLSGAKI
ncbi:MAG: NADAR family protein [Bdellovibrio sp.]|nr:NADAR family protein [Bdellovibrio sp.]